MSDTQNTNGLKLSDSAIAHVAKVLQVALLTGTDIVDNLRLANFEEKDGELSLTKESEEVFAANLQRLMEEIPAEQTEFSLQENSPFKS